MNDSVVMLLVFMSGHPYKVTHRLHRLHRLHICYAENVVTRSSKHADAVQDVCAMLSTLYFS